MTDTRHDSGRTAPQRFAALVAESERIAAEMSSMVAEGVLDQVAEGDLPGLAWSVLATADRGRAVASALVARVDSTSGGATGTLVAGRYASPARWLEAEAGMSRRTAGSLLAVARELRDHAPEVGAAWLAGRVGADSVQQLTLGVSDALKRMSVPAAERDEVRREALAILIPVAERGGPADVRRAVERLRFVLDPDGASQAAMDAYDDQSVRVTRVGAMTLFQAWLTHEAAAATMTVLDQRARRIAEEERAASHNERCDADSDGAGCTCGAAAAAGAVSKQRWPHLLAVAFGEAMTEQLDDAEVGSHHRVAPHVTLTVDLDTLLARLAAEQDRGIGLAGDLIVPGTDEPTPLPDPSVRRILCDSEITRVVTTRHAEAPASGVRHPVLGTDADAGDPFAALTGREAGRCHRTDAAQLLRTATREVLWVGRAERTVPPRLRRLLEARDRHCAFPDCRASVRRCHAHHVQHWEDGGTTDPANTLLLCVRHHHAVHEGGWRLRRAPGVPATSSGAWLFVPPDRPGAPR